MNLALLDQVKLNKDPTDLMTSLYKDALININDKVLSLACLMEVVTTMILTKF